VYKRQFTYLPTAEITDPERMIDFVKWLAAMEQVRNVRKGTFQGLYSEGVNEGQRDSLMDNSLSAAILDLVEDENFTEWTGAPALLLGKLNFITEDGIQRSRDWPDNPIALSKRLRPLLAALLSQGVLVEFGRGKERTITIKKVENK